MEESQAQLFVLLWDATEGGHWEAAGGHRYIRQDRRELAERWGASLSAEGEPWVALVPSGLVSHPTNLGRHRALSLLLAASGSPKSLELDTCLQTSERPQRGWGWEWRWMPPAGPPVTEGQNTSRNVAQPPLCTYADPGSMGLRALLQRGP